MCAGLPVRTMVDQLQMTLPAWGDPFWDDCANAVLELKGDLKSRLNLGKNILIHNILRHHPKLNHVVLRSGSWPAARWGRTSIQRSSVTAFFPLMTSSKWSFNFHHHKKHTSPSFCTQYKHLIQSAYI